MTTTRATSPQTTTRRTARRSTRPGATSRRTTAVLVALLLAGTAACGSGEEPGAEASPTGSAAAETTTEERATDSASAEDQAVPAADGVTVEGPVGEQLVWVLELLGTEPADIDPADIEQRLADDFLAAVPPDQLVDIVAQLTEGTEGPWTVADGTFTGVAGSGTASPATGDPLAIELAVADAEPHEIVSLRFVPRPPAPTSIAAVDEQLTTLGTAALGVYEVTDGSCDPLHELAADTPLALGSSFKLWVLAALAEAVEAGDAAWDEPLAVRPEWRSLPGGEVHALEDGEELDLRRHAELMISISDNTATDHLLHHLGREDVEAAMQRSGLDDPEANVPLLSTGELFAIKFHPDPPSAEDHLALDTDGRRVALDELRDAVPPWVGVAPEDLEAEFGSPGALTEPRNLDVEWLATPADMCATMLRLDELASTPGLEPVAEVLSINPGAVVELDTDRFPTIRFKGGSEPGVAAGSWWVERDDGRQFVVAGAVNNPDVAFPTDQALVPIAAAINQIEELA